jgi:hypothetical protein
MLVAHITTTLTVTDTSTNNSRQPHPTNPLPQPKPFFSSPFPSKKQQTHTTFVYIVSPLTILKPESAQHHCHLPSFLPWRLVQQQPKPPIGFI